MIIQDRRDGSQRVFTQHDHALFSGECAQRFTQHVDGDPMMYIANITMGVHDIAWVDIDNWSAMTPDTLPWHVGNERPHDFTTMPSATKARIYEQGIEEVLRIHPFCALLLSQHYAAFFDKTTTFYHRERERREILRDTLQRQLNTQPLNSQTQQPWQIDTILERQYDILKFLDMVSLFACLKAPGATEATCPTWITNHWMSQNTRYTFSFVSESVLCLDPYPFDDTFIIHLPYRRLQTPPQTPSEALEAWCAADVEIWSLTIQAQADSAE